MSETRKCEICMDEFSAYSGATVCSISCARKKRGARAPKVSSGRPVSEKVKNNPSYIARMKRCVC